MVAARCWKEKKDFLQRESEWLELMNVKLKTRMEELKQEWQQLILMLNRHHWEPSGDVHGEWASATVWPPSARGDWADQGKVPAPLLRCCSHWWPLQPPSSCGSCIVSTGLAACPRWGLCSARGQQPAPCHGRWSGGMDLKHRLAPEHAQEAGGGVGTYLSPKAPEASSQLHVVTGLEDMGDPWDVHGGGRLGLCTPQRPAARLLSWALGWGRGPKPQLGTRAPASSWGQDTAHWAGDPSSLQSTTGSDALTGADPQLLAIHRRLLAGAQGRESLRPNGFLVGVACGCSEGAGGGGVALRGDQDQCRVPAAGASGDITGSRCERQLPPQLPLRSTRTLPLCARAASSSGSGRHSGARMSGSCAAPSLGSDSSLATCCFAHYFVLCVIDWTTGWSQRSWWALSEDQKARLEQLQIDFDIQESGLDKLKPKGQTLNAGTAMMCTDKRHHGPGTHKATLGFPKWDTGPATTPEQQPTKLQLTLPGLHGAKCCPKPRPARKHSVALRQKWEMLLPPQQCSPAMSPASDAHRVRVKLDPGPGEAVRTWVRERPRAPGSGTMRIV
ncbi:hypothetical protein QTO34_017798 [Cnephaeus nilssonii]|uniref:Uncharacterized protein n=1 Tax=Cnephaeus nilssonii TaxID=3371016 RepID=A0AA40I1N6_CNENI|nr:hypothetical protein QTO34_017798 [Eptesicus nilssonii]